MQHNKRSLCNKISFTLLEIPLNNLFYVIEAYFKRHLLELSMKLRSNCPLNIFLDLVGDKWSLLIIRDIFMGANTYSQFLRSPEKIASNLLVDRLKKLQSYGILNIIADKQDSKIKHYYLTEKGIDLYPILAEMMNWTQKYIKVDFHSLSEEMLSEIKQLEAPKHSENYKKKYRVKLEKLLTENQ